MLRLSALSFAALCCASLPLAAQTIERMRLSDGDLSCTQIFAEVQQMDTMIRVMGSAPAPAAAAQSPGAPAAGANPFAGMIPGLGGNAQANSQLGALSGAMAGAQANGGMYDQGQVAALMRMSDDPRVRAAANDPAAVAQMASVMQNPQAYAAMARARQAGVSSASINSNMALLQGVQGLQRAAAPSPANGQVPLSAAAGGNNVQIAQNIAAQGQAYAANVAGGQNWQNALANAQGAAPAAAAPAPAPASNALGGLFGALAARGGAGGNAQAAGLFGALAQQAQGGAAQAPAAAPAPAPVMQAAPAPMAGNAAPIVAQAQGRKDHLTNLFLTKGCKMSEIQR